MVLIMKVRPASRTNAGSLRILCVDDDPDVGRLLVKLLTRAGHSVQYAANGSDAWDLLLDSFDRFNLVVTDNQMPGFTGMELVQLIRKTTYRGSLIVHSGTLSRQELASYVALRVDHIVTKGNTTVELLAAVESVRAKIKPSC